MKSATDILYTTLVSSQSQRNEVTSMLMGHTTTEARALVLEGYCRKNLAQRVEQSVMGRLLERASWREMAARFDATELQPEAGRSLTQAEIQKGLVEM